MNRQLVIIDPQNDFCDPKGALYVSGAEEDSKRLSALMARHTGLFNGINVTLDTHHRYDIAHPSFWWSDKDNKHPDPLTLITVQDVDAGTWRAKHPRHQQRAREYVHALDQGGRYVLCVWPPHCLIGTWGHNVYPCIADELARWEESRIAGFVNYVTKGSNFWTEHYSAIVADVPDPSDPSTQLNIDFVSLLQSSDEVYITGQALSHCVAFTVKDIADNFSPENVEKLILIEDTSSPVPVPMFVDSANQFVEDMKKRGMKTVRSTDL